MSRDLDELMGTTQSRWAVIAASVAITFVVGSIAMGTGASLESVEGWACTTAVCSYVGQLAAHKYVLAPVTRPSKRRMEKIRKSRIPIGVLLPFGAVAAIFVTVSVTAPRVQARVLNDRLKRVIDIPDVGKRSEETKLVLKAASQSKTELKPELLAQLTSELGKNSDNSSWSAYMESINYMYAGDALFRGPTNMGLDYLNETNGSFSYLQITYHGGPMSLDHVAFAHVKFHIDDTVNGRKFAQALAQSPDGVISIKLTK